MRKARSDAATRVEPLGVLPELEEDLLHQLLGQGPVAQDPHREAEGGVAVAAVHLGQRRPRGTGRWRRPARRRSPRGGRCPSPQGYGAARALWIVLALTCPCVVGLRPNSAGGTHRMSTHRPMEGIRILEVAEHTFVPAASAVLADWGAEVIKIEHVERGDAMRGLASTGMAIFAGDVSPCSSTPTAASRASGSTSTRTRASTSSTSSRRPPTSSSPTSCRACARSCRSTSTTSAPTTRTSSTCAAPARASAAPTPTTAPTTRSRSGTAAPAA